MAGIAAASGRGPFGNVMSGISQAAQAAQAAQAQTQEGASGAGDLEGRVAQLESVQAGGAGGGEVAGAGGFSQGAIDQSAKQNPMNRSAERLKQMMGGMFGGNSRFNPFG